MIIGEPTGVNFKYHINQVNAIDTTAWSLSDKKKFHIQADYLFHNYDLIKVSQGQLPVFFGVSGRVKFRQDEKDSLGVRVPFGLAYYFANAPVDIFAEIVPVLELVPDTDVDLEGAIGARFWF